MIFTLLKCVLFNDYVNKINIFKINKGWRDGSVIEVIPLT